MLVEKTIGTVSDFSGKEIEYISVDWHECHKRILKKKLGNGEDIGIKLSDADAAEGLKEGDVLADLGDKIIAVAIAPTEALIIDVPSEKLIPKTCYEIGNRHAPFFNGDKPNQFFTPYDMPIKVMLEKLGVSVDVGMVKLTHDKAISAAVNVHGHSHDDGGYDGKGATSSGQFYDDVDGGHSHDHGHHHDHDHGHHHHDHESHEHEHYHEHGHSHDGSEHTHEHHHHHDHDHEHSHDHDHGHEHGHDHHHNHDMEHAHEHSHDHGHEHSHDHDHGCGCHNH